MGDRKKTKNRKRNVRQTSVLLVETRSRRKKNSKDKYSMYIAILFLTALFAGLLWAAWGILTLSRETLFSHNPKFTISRFDIHSNVMSKKHIMELANLQPGINLFAFNIDKVRKILEAEPIVKSARLKRFFPDKLELTLIEREAVARMGPENSSLQTLVDNEGVLIKKGFAVDHFPSIIGFNFSTFSLGSSIMESKAGDAIHVIELCKKKELSPYLTIKKIAVGSLEHLKVHLTSGTRLLLPRSQIEDNLTKAVACLQKAEDRGEKLRQIDLTISEHPIVQ